MNKAMLCTVKRDGEEKNILIIKNKIDTEAHNLEVDYQLEDTDPDVQKLISSQVGQTLKVDFLEGKKSWEVSSKKMFISNFDYAYDLSSLNDFIDSLITFKANDREIDREIIQMLKNDIFSAAVFWENDTIDQDLTAELILKYWNLESVKSYPENDYYQTLMKFADNKIELIDQKIANFWFDIPASVRNKINEQIEAGKIDFENHSIYLQTRDNEILNTILFKFIKEAAGESQESINNLFEKFHYQLIDVLTKYTLKKDEQVDLKPIIPEPDSDNEILELQTKLEMKDYSLLEIFNHYSIEVNFDSLNLFSEKSSIKTLVDYLKTLISYLEYLNKMREKVKCNSCRQMMEYNLDYSSENAVYKVEAAHCNNSDCGKFEEEIIF